MYRKPNHIKDVLKQVLKGIGGKKRAKKQTTISIIWQETVGEKISSHTQIVDVKQKTIHVKVDSAPLLNELAQFRKKEILYKINQKTPDNPYQDIKFLPN